MRRMYEQTRDGNGCPKVIAIDHPVVLGVCSRLLQRVGIPVITTHDPHELLDIIEQHNRYDSIPGSIGMVMTGNLLRPMRGDEILGAVADDYPDVTRVMMTGSAAPINGYAQYVLTKPFRATELIMTAETGLGEYLLRAESDLKK